MSAVTPAIPGFIFDRVLGTGATSVVYQVRRSGKVYALKLIRQAGESAVADERQRFLKEASTIAKLNHPGLVKLHEVDEFEGRPFLLMELAEGESLKEKIARGSLGESEILSVARQVGRSLDYVHCRGVIHRDLKPENILIGANGDAKLIDFGLATLSDDALTAREIEDGGLAGTLLYASPEQTGMLKRVVDSRSDLYALGGVLYHCATGRPPFFAESAGELLQRHLTAKPAVPSMVNPRIRSALSAMILKLLSKDPDDRYQSARGFLADLENISEIELRGEPYSLGAGDSGLRSIDLPFVGRNEELATVLEVRAQTCAGKGSVLLIAGEGGSGKTRLVRELLGAPSHERLFVLSGKAKRGEAIPFGPLREAIDDAISRSSKSQAAEREALISGFREAAGDLGGIVRRLSPSLHAVFSDAREIPPLEGNAEQERFYLRIAEFLLGLSKSLGPTVLLIDDVQWLDDGTLEIVRQLSKQMAEFPFLLAATTRNDAESKGAIRRFTDAIQGAKSREIVLGPLDLGAIGQLVAAHLGDKALEASSVERIAAKANGNPFAIGEYIRALLDRGMIRPTEGSWVLDDHGARELELPDDVIQLLLNRIGGLMTESVQILSIASVVGFEFDPELLIAASDGKRELVNRALSEGLQSSLIEKSERGYGFVHDRVSEALIEGISRDRLQAIHQKLATTLDAIQSDSPEHLYALARHYYYGLRSENTRKIFETSLAAGSHALENFSNEEAYELLRRALAAGESLGLPRGDFSRIYERIGVACTRLGRPQEAVEKFQAAIEHLVTPFDRARLHYLLGLARASEGQHDLAKTELFKALELLNQPFPRTLPGAVLSLIGQWIAAEFRVRTKIGYGRARGQERERRKLVSKIHTAMSVLIYLLGDELLMAQAMIRELHNVQFLGACVETAKAHVYYAILTGFLALRKVAEKHGRIAVDMAYQLGDQEAIAHCEMNFGLAVEFAGDVVQGRQKVLAAYPKVVRYCDAWDKSIAIGHLTHMLASGLARDNIDWTEQTMSVLRQTGDLTMLHVIYSTQYASYLILGNPAAAARALQLQKKLPEYVHASQVSVTTYYLDVVQSGLMLEQFDTELDEAIDALLRVGMEMYHTRHRFAMIGLVRAEQARRATDPERRRKLLKAASSFSRRAGWPRALTPNHLSLHHALKGVIFSIKKDFSRAEEHLARSERFANASHHVWSHFLVARERARIALAKGDAAGREAHALKALKIAAGNGLVPLVTQIEREFEVRETAAHREGMGGLVSQGANTRLRTAERNVQALLQINLASASTIDPQLQSSAILDELVRILGAERAFLFVGEPERTERLVMRGGRDSDHNDINELKGYSSTVVAKVADTREPIVVCGTEEGEVLGSQSIVANNLRSILAVPVLFREKFVGVIYLDSTLAKGIFTSDDLEIVMAMANHIAISLETARSANELKRELEQKVEERTRELAEERAKSMESSRLASLGEMAAGIAHEINNPLAIIRAATEQIVTRAKSIDDALILKNTDRILTITDRVAKIVKGLRSYSRDGRADPMAEFSVRQLVHDTADFCQARFRNHGVELRIAEIDPSLKVVGREVQVSQVLLNMLNNGFDAIKGTEQTGWVAVEIHRPVGALEIHVVDSGPGVPKELEWKIMQPFFTTKPVGTGTGLGLSISRSIMESHHGQLILDTESVNTRFILRFPHTVSQEVAS